MQLHVAIALYGVGAALQIQSNQGLDPWDAFHQGVARQAGMRIGDVIVVVSLVALVLWIPLRQRIGVGTILNGVLVGVFVNAAIFITPPVERLAWQIAFLLAGIVLSGFASGMSLAAGLGAGPRDGLMVGFAQKFGWSLRKTRLGLELLVLTLGFALGGTVGVGTVAFAVLVGPTAQLAARLFAIDPHDLAMKRG